MAKPPIPSKREILRLLDPLFTGGYVVPERYIQGMKTNPANLPALHFLSKVADPEKNFTEDIDDGVAQFMTAGQKVDEMRELAGGIPDYAKFTHLNTLGIPTFFAKNNINDAEYRKQFGRLPLDLINDSEYVTKLLTQADAQKSFGRLIREIAQLRNPQGLIAYRQPNYSGVDDARVTGVMSMTNNPLDMALQNPEKINYIPYLLKPNQVLSDFSDTPFGWDFENEIQTIVPGAKRLGPALTDIDKLRAFAERV